jgi:hypothetical protein
MSDIISAGSLSREVTIEADVAKPPIVERPVKTRENKRPPCILLARAIPSAVVALLLYFSL